MRRHYRTCPLCEAMCGLAITVEDGRIVEIHGDEADVLSRGHLCPKGPALRELHEDPDRLRQPMRRTASGWRAVPWDEALAEAAERLAAIREEHGRDAIAVYAGNPTVHNHGAMLGLQGLLRALGTRNRFDANSQDANPKLLASTLMYGDALSLTVPDVDRTDFLLMLGANPAASNGSLMSLGDVRGRLRAIGERGGRFVLIDPRRTETAGWATEHHAIRPGGDAAFLLALHQVIFEEGLGDRAGAAAIGRGLDELERLARRFPPERVATRCGLAAHVIRQLARDFARAPRSVAYGRVGVCQNEFAATASWLIETLNVVCGRLGKVGGNLFASPAVDVGLLGRKLLGGGYARWRSRVRGLPEVAGQLPAAAMAEEIETPGEGQIRALLTVAGNPVLSTPNSQRLRAALERLEFMVSIDFYRNETTRHAHLILPPVSPLERSHYDLALHALAVCNTAKYSAPLLQPPAGSRTDWQILYELGMRLGGVRFGVPAFDRAARLLWRAGITPDVDRLVDVLLRLGPYGDRFNPWSRGLNLSRLRAADHGVDLGPLQPSSKARVRTRDGLVELAPAALAGDVTRVERWLEAPPADLSLIGRRHLRSNNSWMHNCPSLVKGPDRTTLLMHPDDGRRLRLSNGQAVRVRSRVGEVQARLNLSDEVMPGVVSLPHGFGHAEAADGLRVAGAVPGPNANELTDELLLDPVSGTAALNGVPVTVEPLLPRA